MTARYSFLLPLLLLPFLFSCKPSQQVVNDGSVQKRKYNSGWHVSNTGSDLDEPEGYESDKEEEKVDAGTKSKRSSLGGTAGSQRSKSGPNPSPPTSGKEGEVAGASSNGSKQERESPQEDCAVITKRDGEEIKAKVKTVGTDKIKYKKCDRPDGPTYTIKKSDVFMIKYPNGDKDVFEKEEEETKEETEREDRSRDERPRETENAEEDSGGDWAGILGFVLSIISLVCLVAFFATSGVGLFILGGVFSLFGLIFSAIGDSGWGTAGLVLSILELIGVLLIIGLAAALLA